LSVAVGTAMRLCWLCDRAALRLPCPSPMAAHRPEVHQSLAPRPRPSPADTFPLTARRAQSALGLGRCGGAVDLDHETAGFQFDPVSYYKTGIPDSMKDLGFQKKAVLGTPATDYRMLVTGWRLRHLADSVKVPAAAAADAPHVPLGRWKPTLQRAWLRHQHEPGPGRITVLRPTSGHGLRRETLYKEAPESTRHGMGFGRRRSPISGSFGYGFSGVDDDDIGDALPEDLRRSPTRYDVRATRAPWRLMASTASTSTPSSRWPSQVPPRAEPVPNGQWVTFVTYGLPRCRQASRRLQGARGPANPDRFDHIRSQIRSGRG